MVNAWSKLSASNQAFVEDAMKLLAHADATQSNYQPDVAAAWNKVNARIDIAPKVIVLPRKKYILSIAAGLLLLVALTIVFKSFYTDSSSVNTLAATAQPVSKMLEDGSVVHLAPHSELKFKTSDNGERRVELKGTAEFEVVHDENKPFVVEAEGVWIRDIGTKFRVLALQSDTVVEVTVTEGEVQFYSPQSEGVNLKQSESAIYFKSSGRFEKTVSLPASAAETSIILEFTDTPLSEVIARIENKYACEIVLANPELSKCKLSVLFNNEELSTILEVVAETLELKLEQKGTRYILSGKSCQ